MTIEKETVTALKNITIAIEAGTEADHMDLTPEPLTIEFIYGLGTAGLSPLELELADLEIGQTVTLRLRPGDLHHAFEHIPKPSFILPANCEQFFLHVKIAHITPSDPREVIRAMAAVADCGDDCCGH